MKRKLGCWLAGMAVLVGACLGIFFLGRWALRGTPAPRAAVTITWLQPEAGQRPVVGQSVTVQVQAAARAAGGSVTRLMVWAEDGVLATASGPAPVVVAQSAWTPARPGAHSLLALAQDGQGRMQVAALTVQVQAAADDADHDGVPDARDPCPEQWGQPTNGCPATPAASPTPPPAGTPSTPGPGDGSPSPTPQAPDEALPSPPEWPEVTWPWLDQDGDGLWDFEDACPTEAGPRPNHGCPMWLLTPPSPGSPAQICALRPDLCRLQLDSDGDGVPDGLDACPQRPGPPSLEGCPLDFAGLADFAALAPRPVPPLPALDPCQQLLGPARAWCEQWVQAGGGERARETTVQLELRLGPFIYTDVAWHIFFCWVGGGGLWARIPSSGGGAYAGPDTTWPTLYWERGVKVQVPLAPLTLRMMCYGSRGNPAEGAVPLGLAQVVVPPNLWDGEAYEVSAHARGPHAWGFWTRYRICAEECK